MTTAAADASGEKPKKPRAPRKKKDVLADVAASAPNAAAPDAAPVVAEGVPQAPPRKKKKPPIQVPLKRDPVREGKRINGRTRGVGRKSHYRGPGVKESHPRPPGRKSTKREHENRVQIVMLMMANGNTRRLIIAEGERLGWGVSTRAVDFYMAEADRRLPAITSELVQDAHEKNLIRLHGLFRKAEEAGDYRTALAVNKDIAETLQIGPAAPAQKIDMTMSGPGGGDIEFSGKMRLEVQSHPERVAALMALGGIGPPSAGFAIGSPAPPAASGEAAVPVALPPAAGGADGA